METKKQGRLPEGVGKKIVEALKQQQIVDVNETPQEEFYVEDNFNNDFVETNQSEIWENDFQTEPASDDIFNYEVSEEQPIEPQPLSQEPMEFSHPQPVQQQESSIQSFHRTPIQNIVDPSVKIPSADMTTSDINVPANVDVLRRLITQLPPGVTRQTGAQIIRQTMEAMGISMNSVLSEAQMAQESLGNSARDCINTIQEYKNNISILEKRVQSYKKQADQLAGLINLFILSDKKR